MRRRSRTKYLMIRDKGVCQYCNCGVLYDEKDSGFCATTDHKIPILRGGGNGLDNLILACACCNIAKDDMTYEEFLAFKISRKLPFTYIAFIERKLLTNLERKRKI